MFTPNQGDPEKSKTENSNRQKTETSKHQSGSAMKSSNHQVTGQSTKSNGGFQF